MVDEVSDQLASLLSEALDLCVRAKKLDQIHELSQPGENGNDADWPVMTRCATPALWIQDQYDRDLHDWETRARDTLARLGYVKGLPRQLPSNGIGADPK